MSSEVLINVKNLTKCYHIFRKPSDRLKQTFFKNKKKFYKEICAVQDVSFEVKKGDTVGIIGRNGAGKSTLLQIIAGTLSPTSGIINVNGKVAALLELGAGFNPEFTGRENIYMNSSIMGLNRNETDAIYEKIISFADIGDFIEQPVKFYSSGMHARLAFASSIFINPDILIVDEILAVGDAPFQRKCLSEFHRLRDNGCTVFLVSHDAYLIKNFCNQALYLNKGKLIAFGNSHSVVDKYMIEVEAALAEDRKKSLVSEEHVKIMTTDLSSLNLFSINNVQLLDEKGIAIKSVKSGAIIHLRFEYTTLISNPPEVVFVFSLYRHDGVYICGKTTLMEELSPFKPGKKGIVNITFPSLPLLAGKYFWRVAIDDDRGFGIYVEEDNVCEFQVEDKMESVGITNLKTSWSVEVVNDGKN